MRSRARRSVVDHPPGTGKARGSNPRESIPSLTSFAQSFPRVVPLAALARGTPASPLDSLRLVAFSLVIVDGDGAASHVWAIDDTQTEPDYGEVLEAVTTAAARPPPTNLSLSHRPRFPDQVGHASRSRRSVSSESAGGTSSNSTGASDAPTCHATTSLSNSSKRTSCCP